MAEISEVESPVRKWADPTVACAKRIQEARRFELLADEKPETIRFAKREIFHKLSLDMIVGIGTDIVDIERIETSLAEFGKRFRDRVFTPGEVAYCEQYTHPGERYAVRFAAKEAVRKALGNAASIRELAWRDVEIISSSEGAPHLRFHGRTAELIEKLQITGSFVSLSHGTKQAVAFVLLERT